MGLLKIQALPEENIATLQENKVGDGSYVELGKQIVGLIHGPVARFLDVLRINYGQYWVHGLEEWDSRRESLGAYCGSLNLKWSLDGGKTWAPFVPDERIRSLNVSITVGRSFREYLTKDDWQELPGISQAGYGPSLAAFLLAEAHQFLDQGNLKHALIEAVSALDVALHDFIRQKLAGEVSLTDSVQGFWELSLGARMISVVTALGGVSLEDMKLAAKAIKMRNDVVHKGWNPPATAKGQLLGLLRTVSSLLPGPRFRFPTANPGNALRPIAEWEKQMEKDDHGG